jgi:hypothetical protein
LFNLPANSTITLTTANGGEIPITNNGTLEIVGTGANNLTIDGGAGTNRIFYTNLATVTISGVTLTGGNATGPALSDTGAGIFANGGSLTLDSVHVTGNGNTSTSNFGGVGVSYLNGVHRIINSTFSDNTANSCGGFRIDSGTLTVVNSTISGNTALNVGGGFCNLGTTTLRNVTITNNRLTNNFGGSGFFQEAGTLNLGNTIVAGNSIATSEIRIDGGVVISAGYNIIGKNEGVETTFPAGNPNANNDIVGTAASPINPLLGPLQNNGGTTPTHNYLWAARQLMLDSMLSRLKPLTREE